eukprot:scaffold596_cov236-Pinguiococcus_pyrenoidosus.AAC.3
MPASKHRLRHGLCACVAGLDFDNFDGGALPCAPNANPDAGMLEWLASISDFRFRIWISTVRAFAERNRREFFLK